MSRTLQEGWSQVSRSGPQDFSRVLKLVLGMINFLRVRMRCVMLCYQGLTQASSKIDPEGLKNSKAGGFDIF